MAASRRPTTSSWTAAWRLKALAAHLSEDERARLRCARQACNRPLASYSDVVTIYDVGENDGKSFIAMEPSPAGTLADRAAATSEPARATASVERDR